MSKVISLAGRTGAVALAVVLSLCGVGLVWFALSSPGSAPPTASGHAVQDAADPTERAQPTRPSAQPSQPPRADKGGAPDLMKGPVLPESDPVVVSIPRLGVRSSLVGLGVDGAGAMEVPQDPAVAGWYTLGPAPGALGPAVIAGHVTWNSTPAVFFRLAGLRPGDRVSVARQDGKRAIFSVSRVERFAKTQFPTRAVFGSIDHAGLRLITCGGAYDDVNHRYLDNVVVFGRLVAVRPVTS